MSITMAASQADATLPESCIDILVADIVQQGSTMDTIPRFLHFLRNTRSIIQHYGPHTVHPGTTVLVRAHPPRDTQIPPSMTTLATSLAAAQDCIGTAQVEGPASDDLQLFKHLSDAAINVIEQILESKNLDQESFGWGILGLYAGYMQTTPLTSSSSPSLSSSGAPPFSLDGPSTSSSSSTTTFPSPASSSSTTSTALEPSPSSDTRLESHVTRLRNALRMAPSIESPHLLQQAAVHHGIDRLSVMNKENRDVHICANLIAQKLRQDWGKVRWWFVVSVAERWVARLGLVGSMDE